MKRVGVMQKKVGASLIEVVISLLLLAMILLEFDATQIISLREARVEHYYSVATQQLDVMSERLLMTKGNNLNVLISSWNTQNQEVLPLGVGVVSGNYPDYKVSIFWGNRHRQDCINNIIGLDGCLYINL